MCREMDTSGWSETDLRLEALRQAVIIVQHGSGYWKDAVLAAADFYDFLSGDISNIDKLSAIADILSDE